MNIAYLGIKGLPSKGGAERVVEAIVRRLAGQHKLTVYCNSRYTPKGVQVPGVRLIRVPTLPGKYLQAISLFVLSALHALFRGNYDLVHVHNAEACFVVPLLRLRYRVIATSHGPAYAREKWGWFGKALIRLGDYAYAWFPNTLTSVSRPLADEYERRYGRRVYYLPNGVENHPPLDMDAAAATLEANRVGGDYILFTAGRLDPTKGCHLLLQAFAWLEDSIQLVVVGDMTTVPTYARELQQMADGRVRFVPFIESKSELFGIVQNARFFVFPSTIEAMSMMLLEVASLGIPVVCSDIPENTNVLGEHALYFKSGDVDGLANKLRWALDHAEALRALGSAAQVWVKQNYSWDVIAEQYEKLYQQMLGGVAVNIPFVDLKAQYHSLKPEMDAAIQSVLERSAFILGLEVIVFEQAFADYVGVKHAIGVGSGTDALRLALEALGVGPGDEVITVANTYIATCEAITHVGATVRLVDADPRTYNVDVDKLKTLLESDIGHQPSAISHQLRAIIPVHLYGQPADMGPIMEIVRKHGLKVIEDCAQAHGARIADGTWQITDSRWRIANSDTSAIGHPPLALSHVEGSAIGHQPSAISYRPVGTFGDVACYSFYPGKNLGAYGDAGAVLTDDNEIAERVRLLRNHGQKVKYEHLVVGYCHRLDNLQAAVLNVKLPHLDEWNAARRSRAALYDQLLRDVPGIVTPYVLPQVEPVYHLYVIRVTDGRRDTLQRYLNEAGIATGLHYPIPVHLQQAYAAMGHKPGDFPVSEQLAAQGLSLPMYPELTDEQVRYVADKIREFMGHDH